MIQMILAGMLSELWSVTKIITGLPIQPPQTLLALLMRVCGQKE